MRILKPFARAVAAETAEILAPTLDGVTHSVDDMRSLLASIESRVARVLAVVERVEAERPGWLGAQRLSDLERGLATFSNRTTDRPNGSERNVL